MKQKNFSLLFSLLLMLIFSTGMVSCGNDDGSLETPKYEEDASRFTITSANSPYSSIELTASGNYLITEKGYSPYLLSASSAVRSAGKQTPANMFIQSAESVTRSSYNGIIYGKYTKGANGEYILDGFGTIKVESNGGTAVDLDITTLNGKNIVVGANRDNMMSDSSMTNKLCRSWKFQKIHYKEWEGGKLVLDETITWKDYQDWEEDEIPENVIFTKAGTYLVTYADGELAISTWRWENESKGILRYSWDYDHLYDEYESGTVQLRFDGNKLVVIEDEYDEEYDERYYSETILVED